MFLLLVHVCLQPIEEMDRLSKSVSSFVKYRSSIAFPIVIFMLFAHFIPAFLQNEFYFSQRIYLSSFSWILHRTNCLTALEASRKQLEIIPVGILRAPFPPEAVESQLPQCLQEPSLTQVVILSQSFSTRIPSGEAREET